MNVIYLKDYTDLNVNIKELSLVLGYFDGVHIGHCNLINFAKENINHNGQLGVLTFDRPLKSIEGSLLDEKTKCELFDELGIDYLFIVVCDDNFKHMSYIDFVDKFLKVLNPINIFCGKDFHFGYKAQGDVNYLKQRFENVYVLGYVKDHNGEKISSTNIKKMIKEGNIKEANRWLGRPYLIEGYVIHGKNNGHLLGFPTANLSLTTDYVLPPNGVYITKVDVYGKYYYGVTNIGYNPTVDKNTHKSIETYIIDYSGDLYGMEISLEFYERIRDEIKFNSLDDLKKQIESDKKAAIDYFMFKK